MGVNVLHFVIFIIMGVEELPASDFVATLVRNAEVKNIGIKVKLPDMKCLVVIALNPDGLVPRWNASCQESQKIQVHDRIVFVNGHDSFDIMMKELMDAQEMEIGILRDPTVAEPAPATGSLRSMHGGNRPSPRNSSLNFCDENVIILNDPGEIEQPDASCVCTGAACLGR